MHGSRSHAKWRANIGMVSQEMRMAPLFSFVQLFLHCSTNIFVQLLENQAQCQVLGEYHKQNR